MEPESSLPHSQVPATSSHPEPHETSMTPYIISLRSILILSSYLHLGIPTSNVGTTPFSHTCHVPRPSHIYIYVCIHIYTHIYIYAYLMKHQQYMKSQNVIDGSAAILWRIQLANLLISCSI